MTWLIVIVGLVAIQRLGELVLANRNTKRLLERGAVEIGAAHYPVMVLMHSAWLVSLLVFIPPDTVPDLALLVVFGLLQLGRVWVIASLGPYWTTRIITLPDAPLVTRGPYRFVKHPNYWVVAGEIAILPLAFGSITLALVFTVLNALILMIRISAENEALSARQPT
ncbi:isoprenylcysteine carboxyl methyltransferase family protein [Coralliovum pocilloporae]|uniref:isoprenylcysteine carboxyl methyltransferase family protein n=1 Tax=Coralliovum pocilloporae TaxID=3066369 RepID=UPI0033070B63